MHKGSMSSKIHDLSMGCQYKLNLCINQNNISGRVLQEITPERWEWMMKMVDSGQF